jgi:hypothetical protein
MTLSVANTAAEPRHMHVAYLVNDGTVFVLYPPDGAADTVAANDSLVLGANGEFVVGEPYGVDMVIALTSPSALSLNVVQGANADAYLSALRAALSTGGGPTASGYLLLTAKPG